MATLISLMRKHVGHLHDDVFPAGPGDVWRATAFRHLKPGVFCEETSEDVLRAFIIGDTIAGVLSVQR